MFQRKIISFLGGGNISRALLKPLIKSGHLSSQIMVSSRDQEKLCALQKDLNILIAKNNFEAVKNSDIVVIAVKPDLVQEVMKEVSDALQVKKPFLISVATGIKVDDINRWSGGGLSIVRAMPNTSALVGEGATALFANLKTTLAQKQEAEALFNTSGKSFWLNSETEINKVTPVIGCGPAYLFLLMEAMEKAAVTQGINPELAKSMVLQTIFGAATMAVKTKTSVSQLRKNVTTPNGATEKALNELLKMNIFDSFEKAFELAEERCKELGESLGKDSLSLEHEIKSVGTNFFKR